MSSATDFTITNLELRESNPDGSEGAGLSHRAEGMFLLHVKEMAVDGEPRGCVTVLHGAGDHGGRYLELGARLSAARWAIALPDLRGHGKSEGERGHSWGLREVVRDVDEVLNHLAYQMPSAPQVLIGQGLGAMYALAYALEKPGRASALVLAAPLLEPAFQAPERKRGLARLFKKPAPTDPGRLGLRAEQLSRDPAQRSAWQGDPLVHDVVTRRADESIREAAQLVRARCGELTVPALVLRGSADPLVSAAAVEGLRAPGLEHRAYAGHVHDLFHDTGHEAVADEVAAWLAAAVPE